MLMLDRDLLDREHPRIVHVPSCLTTSPYGP